MENTSLHNRTLETTYAIAYKQKFTRTIYAHLIMEANEQMLPVSVTHIMIDKYMFYFPYQSLILCRYRKPLLLVCLPPGVTALWK